MRGLRRGWIWSLCSCVRTQLQELPLLAGELGGSEGSAGRIAVEHRDEFRLLQLYLIAAFMEAPYASRPQSASVLQGRECARHSFQKNQKGQTEPSAAGPAPAPHSAAVFHILKQMVSRGARVCLGNGSKASHLTLMCVARQSTASHSVPARGTPLRRTFQQARPERGVAHF